MSECLHNWSWLSKTHRRCDKCKLNQILSHIQPKSLALIAERLAIKMVDTQNWILRNSIIWKKPNAMPASVRDRLKNSYEVVYLFVKNKKYYFDLDAIRVPVKIEGVGWYDKPSNAKRNQTLKDAQGHGGGHSGIDGYIERVQKFKKQDNIPSKNASLYEGFNQRWKELQENKYGKDENNLARKQAYMNEVQGSNIAGANMGDVWDLENLGRLTTRQHLFDQTLFDSIDNEIKAYWFGFLFADGWIDEGRLGLKLAIKDKDHLELFNSHIGTDYEIKQRVTNGHQLAELRIYSKHMIESLLKHHWKKVEAFDEVPSELLHHFIRGLFDGDGSVRFRLASNGTSTDYEVGFVNKEKLVVQKVQNLFRQACNGGSDRIRLYKGGYDFNIGGRKQVEAIGNWLYYDSHVYLRRKRQCFPQSHNDVGDLWTIPTMPFREAHFATFSEKLITPMILAGCPKQICSKCGFIRERQTKVSYEPIRKSKIQDQPKQQQSDTPWGFTEYAVAQSYHETIGWSSCSCNAEFKAGICLDPFLGSGTVAVVAQRLGRNWLGIELKQEYIKMAYDRIYKKSIPISQYMSD